MSRESIEKHRAERNRIFKQGITSPLTEAQKERFTSLTYYPYNPDLDLTVEIRQVPACECIEVQTTSNETKEYQRYGEFSFTVDGAPQRLTLYKAPFGYFVPFIDANAGRETYPAGRYVDPEPIDDTTFHIDFNLAYNPLCAYNEQWNCPITPDENRLEVPILAGEMLPQQPWIDPR